MQVAAKSLNLLWQVLDNNIATFACEVPVKSLYRRLLIVAGVAACFMDSNVLCAAQFPVEQMPIGSEVTIPPTARTTAPLGARIKVSSTDSPQTIRITPVGNGSTFAAPIKLAIFDKNQERVKYVTVNPNEPFLYSFKGLSTIAIQPSLAKGQANLAGGIRMQIESDKAVTLAR